MAEIASGANDNIQEGMTPLLFGDDAARLAALYATGLMDSPAEDAFDRLTLVASRLLNAPVALVSLVDETRQFFKSAQGLKGEAARRRETPLSHSFCRHVVASREPLIIEDARKHPLVRDNGAVKDLGVIAYLGTPIVTQDGHVLGSFCVIDLVPRRWRPIDLENLQLVASSVMSEITLKTALDRRRRSERQALEQRGRATLLSQASSLILASSRIDIMLRDLFQLISGPLQLDTYGYYVLDAHGRLQLGAYGGFFPEEVRSVMSLAAGESVAGRVFQTREPFHACDIQGSDAPELALLRSLGIDAYDCKPLFAGETVLGTLGFGRRSGPGFSPEERMFLRTISHYVAAAKSRYAPEEALVEMNETLEFRIAEAVAQRDQAEESLRQSQKMEAIGQLTGGIAHDFNNMLTGIIGSLDLMKRRIADNRTENLQKFVDTAQYSAARAASLTHRLLAFARRQSLDAKPVDVAELAQSMTDLLRRTLGERIALDISGTPATAMAFCDVNQLESALLNLVLNARDAMVEGGRMTIEARAVAAEALGADIRANLPAVEGSDPARFVAIRIGDDGCGMTAETLARVFEPFYTTKPVGKGTGLGLSMVYGFVKQSGGHVAIDSRIGQGTTVTLYLPAALAEAASAIVPIGRPAPQGAGETVLLVEDDPSVRMLVIEVLEDLGYATIQAADSTQALPVLADAGRRIDLMITDVGLPGLNGRQIAEIGRQYRAGLPVLFITGYAEQARVRGEFLEPGMAMVAKPFALADLAARIRAMMAG